MHAHLSSRRARVASALSLHNEILVISSGHALPLPEHSDQCYPFIADADYFYLTEDNSEGGLIAYDPQLGPVDGWVHFVPEIGEAERIWEGRAQQPGVLLREFDTWLDSRRNRPLALLGAPQHGQSGDPAASRMAATRLQHARRPKDEHEISLLREAAAATAAGFARVATLLKPGLSEREIQVELEAEYFRNGADQTGFGTIVGGGPNSAILHFPPSLRKTRSGEFVLIDSGAQLRRYTADVTRTFFLGKPTGMQRELYELVLSAQKAAIDRCLPGAEWKEIHLTCARDLVAGLVSMGLMKGNPDSLLEREAHALFFPHGIGHMVGLGVRDASGLLPGRTRDPRPSLRSLRMDLPLEENYVVTVEPGLYFIPPLLNDPRRRTQYADCVNWERVDENIDIGGVRIEDDVLVRATGPEVLTASIPKGFVSL